MQNIASEILLSSHQVTRGGTCPAYEFILNRELRVMECVKLESMREGVIRPVRNSPENLAGMLFELSHVRVNPKQENSYIIRTLTYALNEIGVKISHPPSQDSMAICYKPLGEISDNVRFYLNKEGKLIFLSPATRPKLVYSRPKA